MEFVRFGAGRAATAATRFVVLAGAGAAGLVASSPCGGVDVGAVLASPSSVGGAATSLTVATSVAGSAGGVAVGSVAGASASLEVAGCAARGGASAVAAVAVEPVRFGAGRGTAMGFGGIWG